jgi:ketosteroid isomerase-like protein
MRVIVSVLLVTITSMTACAPTSSTPTTDIAAIAGIIDSMDAKVQEWFDREMADSIAANYFAADAVVMNPNAPVMKESEAIRRGLAETFKAVNFRLRIKRNALIAADSVASDQGHYTLEIRAKPDTSKVLATDHGSYVTTFVKRNGQWRAVFDIATSEVPAPATNARQAK